uniref:Helicase ATP-binding domain-containing protein n=1 Tax=viral metagenome TaxID=1070528 RepID=A0A6C0LKE3_9ZZZZ
MNKKANEALCIRNTGTWANVKPEHKFDSGKFNKEVVLKDLPLLSPKIYNMIQRINELDAKDMANDNKYYKHIIYSDVSGVYGAKMVASALIANNFSLIYSNKFAIKPEIQEKDKNKTFGLLTTSTVYQKPLTVGLKKKMMTLMNERPSNVNGENMRIIILDSGYKEGLDVFDVKYMHILEPLETKAEYTQVIGRGTRYCGQAGLPFVPNVGWALNIFRYNIRYDNDTSVHDLYIKHSNKNISAFNFIADIEAIMIASAVDTPLTENLHLLSEKNNRFYDYMMAKNNIKPAVKPKRKDLIEIVNNIRGKIYTNDSSLDCRKKCKGPLEDFPSASALLIIAAVFTIDKIGERDDVRLKKGTKKLYRGDANNKVANYIKDGDLLKYLNERHPKPQLCNIIDKNQNFCDAINKLWMNPINFLKLFGDKIIENLDYYKKTNAITDKNYTDALKFIYEYKSKLIIKKPTFEPVPPKTKMTNYELYKYVEKRYAPYKWEYVDIVNKCVAEPVATADAVDTADAVVAKPTEPAANNLVTFSHTQNFVQKFLTPQSPYKGMLLFHSVGSGKTCTAIATATNTFDREGYRILWVTRHTLKEDIWKNMFDKICNVIIQERLRNGEILPSTKAKRMEFLGKNWLLPISYKQFTNLIKGKNKFYKEMVELNGKEDPFRKTLIIIDEIHKIYSSSLSLLERPNPEVLQTMVQNSYKVSGVNSLKLLLMTATPITDDHMSCVKILNLLLENYERFPEEFERFKTMFCNENGLFTEKGSQEFMNRITGLVSYIDRANDRSQFAYPVIRDVMLEIEKKRVSNSDINDITLKIKEFEERLNNKEVKLTKDETKDLKKDIANLKKEQKNAVKDKETPKDVIDFINSCFTKKAERPPATRKTAKKSKAVDDADADDDATDAGANTGKNEADEDDEADAVAEGTKVAIKVADPKTKTKAAKAAKATKATAIPKSKKSPVAKPVKPVKVCPDGKILNPTTNRCVKMKVAARDDKYSF